MKGFFNTNISFFRKTKKKEGSMDDVPESENEDGVNIFDIINDFC